jgi:UPF0755 protein
MDNMIRRPTPPPQQPVQTNGQYAQTPPPQAWPRPIPEVQPTPPVQPMQPQQKRKRRRWPWVLLTLIVLIAAAAVAGYVWYQTQLSPVNSSDTSRKVVTVAEGSTQASIAGQLKREGLIRDEKVFSLYTRLSGEQASLQAGTYRLSPSESLPQIVDHLKKGNIDAFSIQFLPGGTLADHKKVLLNAGYSNANIDAAFNATYSGTLFEGRPAGSDIEGYIYGETYSVNSGATVEDVLQITFKQFEQVIAQNDLKAKFQQQGLSLYQGITLASIIQREASGNNDEATIAQVFYNRYRQGMVLGSDVTYQYAADKEGRERSTTLDSPYNTRINPGLTPTPISSPGLKALQAVANPTVGDFLYFLSGDDDVTYYGRTIQEHEANIQQHCQKKCQII